MIRILILLCAAGTSPADCSRATAVQVLRAPERVPLTRCPIVGLQWQASMAGMVREGEVVRIVCGRPLPRFRGRR